MADETTTADAPLVSARRDPWWINQATVKGALSAAAGVALLAAPTQDAALSIILGVLLAGWGLAELWFGVVRKARREGALVIEAVAMIVIGGLLLVDFGFALTRLVGVAIVLRGFVGLGRMRGTEDRQLRASIRRRALLLIMVGGVVTALPEAAALGIRAALGGSALAIGAMLIHSGLHPGDDRHARDAALMRIDSRSAARLATDWLAHRKQDSERARQISEDLLFEPPDQAAKLTAFWVMMLLATAIAAFAVIQDSTAVVIGAMLVAPLMTPIMGTAASIVNGWPRQVASSLALALGAAVAAIALSWLIAAWLPGLSDLATNSQVTSRTSPSLLDLCIAIAAGAAGAYATVDRRVSSSLSGVAIAVALVPPLAVVGITLEAEQWSDAGGATLLFATNFVSIILAGVIVFILTGFAAVPPSATQQAHMRRVLETLLIGALLILVPLSLTSISIWDDAAHKDDAIAAVAAWIPPDSDLSSIEVTVDGVEVAVTVTGSDTPPPVTELQASLNEAFGKPVDLTLRLVPSQLLSG